MDLSASRRSSVSNTDSGICCDTTATGVNPRYKCYWSDKCNGQHELDDCRTRSSELRGKLGIYYSPNAIYKRFLRDTINELSLEHNPTGCTMVHLLIYKRNDNETWLLLATKSLKEKPRESTRQTSRQLLLTFPSSYPRVKGEIQKDVAARALKTITDNNEIARNLRSRLKRFLFVDANVIYPLYFTDEHTTVLTSHFSPDDEIHSLHWFPLSTVLSELPEWNNYLARQETATELAQIRHHDHIGIKLNKDNDQYILWSVAATCLMCIRNHVGFDEFLTP